jgi:hypothetical protein
MKFHWAGNAKASVSGARGLGPRGCGTKVQKVPRPSGKSRARGSYPSSFH